jgi:hypothetical protein
LGRFELTVGDYVAITNDNGLTRSFETYQTGLEKVRPRGDMCKRESPVGLGYASDSLVVEKDVGVGER